VVQSFTRVDELGIDTDRDTVRFAAKSHSRYACPRNGSTGHLSQGFQTPCRRGCAPSQLTTVNILSGLIRLLLGNRRSYEMYSVPVVGRTGAPDQLWLDGKSPSHLVADQFQG